MIDLNDYNKRPENVIGRIDCRRTGEGFSLRVYETLRLAFDRGADMSMIVVAEDHKGHLSLTVRRGDRYSSVAVRDLNIIALCWEEYAHEIYEHVNVIEGL